MIVQLQFHGYKYNFSIGNYNTLKLAILRSIDSVPRVLDQQQWSQDIKDTCLTLACKYDYNCIVLFEHGARPNLATIEVCCKHQSSTNFKNIKYLVQYPITNYEVIIRHLITTYSRCYNILEILDNLDYDFDSKWSDGNSFLLLYCKTHRRDLINIVDKYKLNIHIQDNDGNTPLHFLVKKQQFNLVNELMEKNRQFIQNNEKLTVFGMIIEHLCLHHHISTLILTMICTFL